VGDHVTVMEAIREVLVQLVVVKRVNAWHHFRYTKILQIDAAEVDRLRLWVT